jgi:hypothetical protein
MKQKMNKQCHGNGRITQSCVLGDKVVTKGLGWNYIRIILNRKARGAFTRQKNMAGT